MAEMTSEERLLRVLQRKEPDRVPHFEWMIDRRVREALCPGNKGNNDFAVKMGHDAVIFDVLYTKERVGPDRWRSEWGFVTQDTPEEHGIEVESPIKTTADFERYTPPVVVTLFLAFCLAAYCYANRLGRRVQVKYGAGAGDRLDAQEP